MFYLTLSWRPSNVQNRISLFSSGSNFGVVQRGGDVRCRSSSNNFKEKIKIFFKKFFVFIIITIVYFSSIGEKALKHIMYLQ